MAQRNPSSPVAAVRNKRTWDEKLRARGHRLRWEQVAPWPARREQGICVRCGAGIECGTGPAKPAGNADIRKTRQCVPQEQSRRPLLRLLTGGR
jgi:hypothetical protein